MDFINNIKQIFTKKNISNHEQKEQSLQDIDSDDIDPLSKFDYGDINKENKNLEISLDSIKKAIGYATEAARLALDEAGDSNAGVNVPGFNNSLNYNKLLNYYSFIPFAELSLLAQVPLIYNACDTYATEMMRAEYEFVSIEPTDQDERIFKLLKSEFTKYGIEELTKKMYLNCMIFGGSMLYPKYKIKDDAVLKKELMLGNSIAAGTLKEFIVIEPTWCYPTNANYSDALEKDFYSPFMYNVIGKNIHASRLYKMVFNPVPDLIKPIYFHYGLSLVQKIVRSIWQFTEIKDTILEIVKRFNLVIYKVDITKYAQNSDTLKQKLKNFNFLRSNFGTLLADKNSEEIEQITLSLQNLDQLLGRYAEIICMDIQIPASKWLGIAPSGFNAADESSHRNWYDLIYGLLLKMGKPYYERVIRHVLLDNGIDSENYTVRFKKLYQSNKLEDAQINDINSRIDSVYLDKGIVSPEDIAKRIKLDKDGNYNNIDILEEYQDPLADTDTDNENNKTFQ